MEDKFKEKYLAEQEEEELFLDILQIIYGGKITVHELKKKFDEYIDYRINKAK